MRFYKGCICNKNFQNKNMIYLIFFSKKYIFIQGLNMIITNEIFKYGKT